MPFWLVRRGRADVSTVLFAASMIAVVGCGDSENSERGLDPVASFTWQQLDPTSLRLTLTSSSQHVRGLTGETIDYRGNACPSLGPNVVPLQDAGLGICNSVSVPCPTYIHWDIGIPGGSICNPVDSASAPYTEAGVYDVTLTVSGPGGIHSRTETVEVVRPPAPSVSITPRETAAPIGFRLTIDWDIRNVSDCPLVAGAMFDLGDPLRLPIGSDSVDFLGEETYRVRCNGFGDNDPAEDSATVAVLAFMEPPTVSPGTAIGGGTRLDWALNGSGGIADFVVEILRDGEAEPEQVDLDGNATLDFRDTIAFDGRMQEIVLPLTSTDFFVDRLRVVARNSDSIPIAFSEYERLEDLDPRVLAGFLKASNTDVTNLDQNTDSGDGFGSSIAVSADGNTIAVGAPREDGDSPGIGGDPFREEEPVSGAVYVFTKPPNTLWTNDATVIYVKASTPDNGDEFGSSVSLSADGTVLAVGAPNEDSPSDRINGDQDDDGACGAGAAYVFRRNPSDPWDSQASTTFVKAWNSTNGDNFGTSVALSSDGDELFVGAPGEAGDATGPIRFLDFPEEGFGFDITDGGAVYHFRRVNISWVGATYMKGPLTPENGDQFGESLAISGDGTTLVVGAPGEQTSRGDFVSVFRRDTANPTDWSMPELVVASSGDSEDHFGAAVAISFGGDFLAVGAPREDGLPGLPPSDDSAVDSGAVYYFAAESGSFSQRTRVKASNGDGSGGPSSGIPGDNFGTDVALSSDGTILAVGAPLERGSGAPDNGVDESGAVYIFSCSNTGCDPEEDRYVKAPIVGEDDRFGSALGLAGPTGQLVVGAPFEDSDSSFLGGDPRNDVSGGSGAAYLY